MPIDINLLRPDRGGNPETVKESQRRRNASVELVDTVMALDAEAKAARYKVAFSMNAKINELNKKIGALMKAGEKEKVPPVKEDKKKLEAEKVELERLAVDAESRLETELAKIGNIVHESCIVSNDEENNAVQDCYWPNSRSEQADRDRRDKLLSPDFAAGVPGLLSHHEVLAKIKGYDQDRGVKVAGHRGYFLTGPGVDLNLAIIRYALDFLEKRDFSKLWTPFFMKKDMMAKTAQLEDFDEALYNITGDRDADGKENADTMKYLIATSEQPISAYHAGEWFSEPEKELPKKYAGQSTCFRKEAGCHGKETWGIFRVHQFEKVEQFCLTEPSKSWEMLEEMIQNSRDFYQSLKLPYRVVSIVSGALNNAAAKKYDLEAWFPYQAEYKELVSASNCTDYQTRSLEIRYGAKKMKDPIKHYVHALNSTLAATSRTICCILENYQTEEGVTIPEVLVPYMNGKTFIPFPKAPEKVEKK
ncbi:MAG: hypothetical protein SGCHY_000822 [Lobulomycetales sp.]